MCWAEAAHCTTPEFDNHYVNRMSSRFCVPVRTLHLCMCQIGQHTIQKFSTPEVDTAELSKILTHLVVGHRFTWTGSVRLRLQFAFTRMPGESYRRRLGVLLLCLCDVFRVLINSPVCWFSLRGRRNKVLNTPCPTSKPRDYQSHAGLTVCTTYPVDFVNQLVPLG